MFFYSLKFMGTFFFSLHCFREGESLQRQREIVDSSRISSCMMWGGEPVKTLTQISLFETHKTDISVIARPTFNLPHSVTICLSYLTCHSHVPHIALFFSQKSTHTRHILWGPWPCCWTGRTVVIMIAEPVYKLSSWRSADPKRGPGNVYSGYSTSPLHWEMERKRGRGSANTNERWREWYILCVSLQLSLECCA